MQYIEGRNVADILRDGEADGAAAGRAHRP